MSNQFRETLSPTICCIALGMNPQMYAKFPITRKQGLTLSSQERGGPARFYKYPPPLGSGPHGDPGYWAMGWHSILAPHDNNPRLVSGNVLLKTFKSNRNLGLSSHDRPRCFHVKRTSLGRRDHPSQPTREGDTLSWATTIRYYPTSSWTEQGCSWCDRVYRTLGHSQPR